MKDYAPHGQPHQKHSARETVSTMKDNYNQGGASGANHSTEILDEEGQDEGNASQKKRHLNVSAARFSDNNNCAIVQSTIQ